MINPVFDIVLPVHNEAKSIEKTLADFYKQASQVDGYNIRFVICEDGSTDNSVEILTNLSKTLPIFLITSPGRKGYSRAVLDGFRATTADAVGFIDSDGQCDPKDFKSLLAAFNSERNPDLVIGYRSPRSDHWIRILMSSAFKLVYQVLFPIRLKDPSCPYLLIRRPLLQKILSGKIAILKQGFWWEFFARALLSGARYIECPVNHLPRLAGQTQVYLPTKVPRIAYEHIVGLFKLRREMKQIHMRP